MVVFDWEELRLITQWCLPFLRQHTGTLAADAFTLKNGSVRGSENRISSEMASVRRMQSLLQMSCAAPELHVPHSPV